MHLYGCVRLTETVTELVVQRANSDTSFAVYSDHQNHVWVLGASENIPLSLGAGSSDMLSIAPVMEKEKLSFAAIGLVNLLNTNGTVLGSELSSGSDGILVAKAQVALHTHASVLVSVRSWFMAFNCCACTHHRCSMF